MKKTPHLSPTQRIGHDIESLALDYLTQQGLTFVERNFRCKMGEIDLILMHKQQLVFVEVRYRASDDYGGSALSITRHKKSCLMRTALLYLQQKKLLEKISARFDVVCVEGNHENIKMNWIQNAFSE